MIIKTDPDITRSYFEDSSNLKGGKADKVILPESESDVIAVLKEANSAGTPVTISGGGTATTGSRIAFGGIVMSMERLSRVIDISRERSSAIVQAGVSVEALKAGAENSGLFYTSHPTEKSAFVGGTISTNASGSRSFKYGPTRKYVKRLKMALPSGKIFEISRGEIMLSGSNPVFRLSDGTVISIPIPSYKMPAVKNAAGYFAGHGTDLLDLFIGQEGTLSVILEAEMGLVKKPAEIFSAFVFFKSDQVSWNFSRDARKAGTGVLSIEYFGANALDLVRAKNPNVPSGMKAAIFLEEEVPGEGIGDIPDKWLKLLSKHNASIDDTWVAMNERDADSFTQLRYAIPEAINDILHREGIQKLATDIAVPEERFLEMMMFYKAGLEKHGLRNVVFGHIGENHVHVNILPRSEKETLIAKQLALEFVRKAVAMGGTVSAEHGIGKLKHGYLEEMYGRSGVLEMARIKRAIDPKWLLGQGNIFPKEVRELI